MKEWWVTGRAKGERGAVSTRVWAKSLTEAIHKAKEAVVGVFSPGQTVEWTVEETKRHEP